MITHWKSHRPVHMIEINIIQLQSAQTGHTRRSYVIWMMIRTPELSLESEEEVKSANMTSNTSIF